MSEIYKDELLFAKDLAYKAGEIMLEYFNEEQHKQIKDDGTPVTIADITINQLVIEEISSKYPNDGIVGEEKSKSSYGLGRLWVCDPIDGTAAFTYGIPTAMFSLALVIDGVPKVGVVYEPVTNKLFWAVSGSGSYCNNEKISVNNHSIRSGEIALAPEFVADKYINEPFMKGLLKYGKTLAIFPGAVCRSSLVASGRLAGFVHPAIKPYDIAASHVIIEEAGGKVSNLHGHKLDYSDKFMGAIISNGFIHDDLLNLFR